MATKRPRTNTVPDPGGGAGAGAGPSQKRHEVEELPFQGAILVTYRKKGDELQLLVGRETNYLTDSYTEVIDRASGKPYTIVEREKLDVKQAPTVEAAKDKFKQRARWFSEQLGFTVLADIPELIEDGTFWKINYRITTDASKFGFTKGQRKGEESALETIQREFGEETGTRIDHPEHIIELGNTFPRDPSRNYRIFINHAEYGSPILRYFTQNRLGRFYGELTELRFRSIQEVYSLYTLRRFNSHTRSAIDTFFTYYFTDEWNALEGTAPIPLATLLGPPRGAAPALAPGGGAGARTRRTRRRKMRKTRRSR